MLATRVHPSADEIKLCGKEIMNTNLSIRQARPDELDALGAIMFDAIHNGPSRYTKEQSLAWAPEPRHGPDWASRLSGKQIFVAARNQGLLGFMTIESGGYIDFAYIRPGAQRSGVFRQLYNRVLMAAREAREAQLSTHASLMAQPAFAAMGFTVETHELIEVGKETLARAHMTKRLET